MEVFFVDLYEYLSLFPFYYSFLYLRYICGMYYLTIFLLGIFTNNFQILLMGGIDTSSITLEWAMSNLFNHPDILNNAKVKMNNLLGHGQQKNLIDESASSKLQYLRSIISNSPIVSTRPIASTTFFIRGLRLRWI